MGICTLSPFVVSSCRSSLALCGYNNLLGHERNNQRTALCRDSVHKINAGKPVINIKIVIIHPPFEMNIIHNAISSAVAGCYSSLVVAIAIAQAC